MSDIFFYPIKSDPTEDPTEKSGTKTNFESNFILVIIFFSCKKIVIRHFKNSVKFSGKYEKFSR